MRIVWSPLAIDRIADIAAVIATDNQSAAEKWVRSVFARVSQLGKYPESGPMVPELGRPEIRQLPHPPYRIIYRVEPKRLLILTVRHGRQELDPGETEDSLQP